MEKTKITKAIDNIIMDLILAHLKPKLIVLNYEDSICFEKEVTELSMFTMIGEFKFSDSNLGHAYRSIEIKGRIEESTNPKHSFVVGENRSTNHCTSICIFT